MRRALYGPDGFYRRERPVDHFRTSSLASPLFARAVLALVAAIEPELRDPTVVDVGCGSGELLAALAPMAPEGWRLVGVELRPRPEGLDGRIEWVERLERPVRGLLLANEWLDNIPVDRVRRSAEGWRQLLVARDGRETAGPEPDAEAACWLDRWWPDPEVGDVVEVGRHRDRAWAELTAHLETGLAVAVDYTVDRATHRRGTLSGYRQGRLVDPVPDGTCDLTAHVLMESVAAAGEGAGLTGTTLLTQRAALSGLGLRGARPPLADATTDPAGYLRALADASQAAELLDDSGLGGFRWLIQGRGVEPSAVTAARG